MEFKSSSTATSSIAKDSRQRLDDILDVGRIDLIFPSKLHKDISLCFASFLDAVVMNELEVGKGAAFGIL